MASTPQRQVLLVARPDGVPLAEHFAIVTADVRDPDAGEVLVRNEFLSVDPAMRGWVNAASNYADPVPLGGVMRSFAVGTVEASRADGISVGETVVGMFGWQERATVPAAAVHRRVSRSVAPVSTSLGVLGLTGATAWFGLTEIGRPRPGDTVVVSTAAGSVGSAVGQLAGLAGCRTVGIAGGPQKVRLCLEEFGYDAAVDYRSPNFQEELAAATPHGVDVYFDNTSGPVSDAVLQRINVRARIVVCGTAAFSSWDPPPQGPVQARVLLTRRARMEGFLFFDYEHRLDEALTRLTPLVRDGRLRYREDVLDGIESAPGSIAGLHRGENLGKRVIRL